MEYNKNTKALHEYAKNKAIQWISRVKKRIIPFGKKVLNDIVYDIFKRLIIMAVLEAFKQIFSY